MTYHLIRSFARENRKNQTKAEKVFWQKVRNRKLFGLKINRQFVIPYRLNSKYTNYFIADFYCHALKLVIEIDGDIHLHQKDADQERDKILTSLGLKTLRFENETILNNWNEVEVKINELL